MRLRNFVLFALMIFVWGACSVEEEVYPIHSDSIDFQASVSAISRTSMQHDGSGEFQQGDRIALWVYHDVPDKTWDKTELQFDGQRWSSSLFWSNYTDIPHFFAVWPSDVLTEKKENEYRLIHQVHTNQSNEKERSASDILIADAAGDGHSTVYLNFRHVMSRIKVVLKNAQEVLSQDDISRMQVFVHGYLSGTCTLSGQTAYQEDDYGWILTHHKSEENFCYEALVFPSELARFRTEGWIKIVIGDKELLYNVPESIGDVLESGKQVTLNLTLKQEGTITGNGVWWVDGVRPSEEWEYDEPVFRMRWAEGCGWFDCNKLNASDKETNGDGRTCWEASASNLMHWWIEMNREYVDRYVEYKRKQSPDFSIPQAYPDSKHSEIYQRFKARFGNREGYAISGVNWFLSGICNQKMYPQDIPELEDAGYFFEVFGRNSLARQYGNGYILKEEFNQAIQIARREGMAVGLDIYIQGGGHAVNLWGAEFDENGNVDTIYLVDNNDGSLGSQMYKAKIIYVQDNPGGPFYTRMKWMYNENLEIKIMDLVLVNRGLSYWNAFFE